MKKSEIVLKCDIDSMAETFGLRKTEIKLALTMRDPSIDQNSISKISSLKSGLKLYRKAKSNSRKYAIAEQALNCCNTLDDLQRWRKEISYEQAPILRGKYILKLRKQVTKAIEESQTFDQIHSIWVKCDDDALGVEDMLAYQKMKVLVNTAHVKYVLHTFFDDIGTETLYDGYAHHEIIVLACKYASPQSALEALKDMQEHCWNGEQDSYPIRLLIQKASELFK